MFETLQAVSALAHTIELAYGLWDAGFSKVKNAQKQYLDFGAAIHSLGRNLDQIRSAAIDAQSQLQRRRLDPVDCDSLLDSKSLDEIAGCYAQTLADCERLLRDKARFRHDSRNFVLNIIWNYDIEPDVERLRARLEFHNAKISMLLEPLKLKMMADISALVQDLHEEVMIELKEIKGILNGPNPEAAAQGAVCALVVPDGLAARLDHALAQDRPGCRELDEFPLQLGMDAFARCFQDARSSSETDTYLNLTKCLWIMGRVRTSAEFKRLANGSLWQRYVEKMDRSLTEACNRWKQSPAPEPDMETILRLPDSEFRIWKTEEEADGDELSGDESVFLTELLSVTLPSGRAASTHKLRVLQNVDSTIQIQDIATTTSEGKTVNDIHRFDAYLDKAHLIPIYASPSSSSNAFNVKFKSDKASANGISPSFASRDDLLRFQEIITGYRTMMHLDGLDVERHHQPKFLFGGESRKDRGKVQIWQKTRMGQRQVDEQSSQKSAASPDDRTSALPGPKESTDRRPSKPSLYSPSAGLSAKGERDSRASTAQWSIAEGSVSSTMFTGTRFSRIQNGSTSTTAVILDKPDIPKLVLFLESKKSGTLSFLSIDIDEHTHIDIQSCDCRRSGSRCKAAVIEHRRGPLQARHIISDQGLKSWNVASLGTAQTPKLPDPFAIKDLRWVKLQFGSVEERIKFSERFNQIRDIHLGRLADFYKQMRVVQTKNLKPDIGEARVL